MDKVVKADHPKSSALALHLQTMEHEVLAQMAGAAEMCGLSVLCLVFDGLYVAASTAGVVESMFDVVAAKVWETAGVRIALKTLPGNVVRSGPPSDLLPAGSAEGAPPTKKMKEMSLTQSLEKVLTVAGELSHPCPLHDAPGAATGDEPLGACPLSEASGAHGEASAPAVGGA